MLVFVVPRSMAQVVQDPVGCREPWAHQTTAAAPSFTQDGSQTASPSGGLLHKVPHKHGQQAADLKCEVRSNKHIEVLLALQLIIHLSLSFSNHGLICAVRRRLITLKLLCTTAPEPARPFHARPLHQQEDTQDPFPHTTICIPTPRYKQNPNTPRGPQLGGGRLGEEGEARSGGIAGLPARKRLTAAGPHKMAPRRLRPRPRPALGSVAAAGPGRAAPPSHGDESAAGARRGAGLGGGQRGAGGEHGRRCRRRRAGERRGRAARRRPGAAAATAAAAAAPAAGGLPRGAQDSVGEQRAAGGPAAADGDAGLLRERPGQEEEEGALG